VHIVLISHPVLEVIVVGNPVPACWSMHFLCLFGKNNDKKKKKRNEEEGERVYIYIWTKMEVYFLWWFFVNEFKENGLDLGESVFLAVLFFYVRGFVKVN
jgi:hypothetical protein